MRGLKWALTAALMAMLPAATALAQEPSAFQAQFPNRDVLNGGALTPAGQMGLEAAGGAVPSRSPTFDATGAESSLQPAAPSTHSRARHHRRVH